MGALAQQVLVPLYPEIHTSEHSFDDIIPLAERVMDITTDFPPGLPSEPEVEL